MTQYAHIAGWGMYVPSRRLTNEDLAKRVDTSDEWIRTRTGIVERRIAADSESTASMAIEAARQAMQRADVTPSALDAIIVATVTSDYATPSTACLVQAGLGAVNAAAFDISAGCTGFVYGLGLGRMAIAAAEWSSVLVIGAETLSRVTDWSDRNTCVLFGDGAGAVLLVARTEPGGILSVLLGADGSGAELLQIPAGGSRRPASAETIMNRQHNIAMDGQAVFRFATRVIPDAVNGAIAKAGLALDDVDLVIPHQANIRIIDAARKRLGMPQESVYVNLERYGNTSAASIPIALCEAAEDQLINDGSHLVLVGFGAGLTWGAVALRWGVSLPTRPTSWWHRNVQRAQFVIAHIRMVLRRFVHQLWRRLPPRRE